MRYRACGLVILALFSLSATAGDVVVDGKIKSTQASGAPLEVASTDMVVNLNADMVDGIDGTDLYTKAQVDALAAPREYYLDDGSVSGAGVLTACATGFHFANLFELSQLSNLRYASDQVGAVTTADAGEGPPTESIGWIRTGGAASVAATPGLGNCNAWASDDVSHYGTAAKLPGNWADPAAGGSALVWGMPWAVHQGECNHTTSVWCIED